jgi:hypothetical protein
MRQSQRLDQLQVHPTVSQPPLESIAQTTIPDQRLVMPQSLIDRLQDEIDVQMIIQLPAHDIARPGAPDQSNMATR